MGSLDFLANVMAAHNLVTTAEAVERAASLWRGHPPTDRSDITRAFAERPEMFTPEVGHSGFRPDDPVEVRFAHAVGGAPVGGGSVGGPPPVDGSESATAAPSDRARMLQKVRDLMAVAVGRANDNEARANAVIACKLIVEHDLLKGE